MEQRILRAKYAFAPEPIFFAAQTLYGMYLLDLVPSLAARSRVSLSPIRPLPPPLSLLQFSSLCTQLPQVFYMYSSLSFARFSIIISLSSSSSLILSIYLSHSLFTYLSYILSLSLIFSLIHAYEKCILCSAFRFDCIQQQSRARKGSENVSVE